MNQSTVMVLGVWESTRFDLVLLYHPAALSSQPSHLPWECHVLARTHANAERACLLPLQQLSSSLLHPCDAGKELCNQSKNRYKSIIPCKQGLAQALGVIGQNRVLGCCRCPSNSSAMLSSSPHPLWLLKPKEVFQKHHVDLTVLHPVGEFLFCSSNLPASLVIPIPVPSVSHC